MSEERNFDADNPLNKEVDHAGLDDVSVPPDEEVFSAPPLQERIEDETEEPTNEGEVNPEEPRVNVGLHPLGGIGISVRGADGEHRDAQISIDEAWTLVGHLSALTSMLVGSAYAQAAMEQQAMRQMASEIIMPPGHKG